MAKTRIKLPSNQIKVQNTPEPTGNVIPIAYDDNGAIVDYSNNIPLTYEQLTTLVTNNELRAGQYYQIIDYRTKHVIPTTTVINEGELEPLVLLATSPNTFAKQVYSPTYPKDIIEYDFDNNLCEDNTTPRNGWITYRKDTVLNIEVDGYDWREVRYRRRKVISKSKEIITATSPTTLDCLLTFSSNLNSTYLNIIRWWSVEVPEGTLHASGQLTLTIRKGAFTYTRPLIDFDNSDTFEENELANTRGMIFYCTTRDAFVYMRFYDFGEDLVGRYVGVSANEFFVTGGGYARYQIDQNDYVDVTTFDLTKNIRNVKIEKTFNNNLPNNVFFDSVELSSFNYSCYNNTFVFGLLSVTAGTEFYSNIISSFLRWSSFGNETFNNLFKSVDSGNSIHFLDSRNGYYNNLTFCGIYNFGFTSSSDILNSIIYTRGNAIKITAKLDTAYIFLDGTVGGAGRTNCEITGFITRGILGYFDANNLYINCNLRNESLFQRPPAYFNTESASVEKLRIEELYDPVGQITPIGVDDKGGIVSSKNLIFKSFIQKTNFRGIGITWDLNKFVLVEGMDVRITKDGYNEKTVLIPPTDDVESFGQAITNFQGNLVVVGFKLEAISYDGGDNWESTNPGDTQNWISVDSGNGRAVAVASTGTDRVKYTTNGINWIPVNVPALDYTKVRFLNDTFYLISQDSTQILYSVDGENWNSVTIPSGFWRDIGYLDGTYMVVGGHPTNTNRLLVGDSINTLTLVSPENVGNLANVIGGNGWFILTTFGLSGNSTRVLATKDGLAFTTLLISSDVFTGRDLAYGNGVYLGTSPESIVIGGFTIDPEIEDRKSNLPAFDLDNDRVMTSTAPDGKIVKSNVLDPYTGEMATFMEHTGSTPNIDGIIFIQSGIRIFKRAFTGPANIKWFGAMGDGATDDTLSFTKAVASDINELYIPDGTYIVNGLVITKPIKITGKGTLKKTDFTKRIVSVDFGNSYEDKDLFISGITIDGNEQGIITPHADLFIKNVDELLIRGCTFLNTSFMSLQITYPLGSFKIQESIFKGGTASLGHLSNDTVRHITASPPTANPYPDLETFPYPYGEISNCLFQSFSQFIPGPTQSTPEQYGQIAINTVGVKNLKVVNNTITGGGFIDLYSLNHYAEISGNHIENAHYPSIKVQESGNVKIHHNTILNPINSSACISYAPYIRANTYGSLSQEQEGAIIESNIIDGATGYSIEVVGATHTTAIANRAVTLGVVTVAEDFTYDYLLARNVSVKGNIIRNSNVIYGCIFANKTKELSISGNSITNVSNSTGSTLALISLTLNYENTKIFNNQLDPNGGINLHGIYANFSSSTGFQTGRKLEIENNIIKGINGSNSIAIYSRYADVTLINGNIIEPTGTYDVLLLDGNKVLIDKNVGIRPSNTNVACLEKNIQYNINNKFPSNTIPTTGTFFRGDYIEKIIKTIEGNPKYVVNGWLRITNGSNHVLNTDWVEDRVIIEDITISVPDASDTVKGIAERATQAEVTAGGDAHRFVVPATLYKSGPTGSRTIGTRAIGLPFFDTTLGKPIWWDGTVWKDATGTTV